MLAPSVFFGVAVFAVDPSLLPREHEQHDDEHDQRALRGHVEAEWETEDRNRDLIQDIDEHMDDVAEEEPDPEMREHQFRRSIPVSSLAFRSISWSIGF